MLHAEDVGGPGQAPTIFVFLLGEKEVASQGSQQEQRSNNSREATTAGKQKQQGGQGNNRDANNNRDHKLESPVAEEISTAVGKAATADSSHCRDSMDKTTAVRTHSNMPKSSTRDNWNRGVPKHQ
jgi:hypothetical protein